MTDQDPSIEPERYEFLEPPRYRFSLTRRTFVQTLGAGILIGTFARGSFAQRPSRSKETLAERFHIDENGNVTAYTGKVEVGQGSRTQISLAVAEELRVPVDSVSLVMADTDLVPNDGGTYGSLTTPRTIPTMRQAAATARELLIELAEAEWSVKAGTVTFRDSVFTYRSKGRRMSLGELVAAVKDMDAALGERSPSKDGLTALSDWSQLGRSTPKAEARGIVTGAHRYSSDIKRPGTVYGKVLRAPSYNAELEDVDLGVVDDMKDVKAVRDGDFVGCVAPTTHQAQRAIDRLGEAARWKTEPHPSSAELFQYLKDNVRDESGRSRSRTREEGKVDEAIAGAAHVVRASYTVPYIQHAPMETRAAAAEWSEGRLTVWTGTQRPFGVRDQLAQAFSISRDKVRVIVPDTGGGFGGKHTPDAAVEAARLAKAAGRPVSLQWTREEEFTWAYFRPAGLMEVTAALDSDGGVTAWDFLNYNSGTSGIDCFYTFPNKRTQFRYCESPLREGSYRALAATANTFAREAFIDRLAKETGKDALQFRLDHLEHAQMRGVLEAAAKAFGWDATQETGSSVGRGIACGTEKGSFIATCAEVEVDSARNEIRLRRVCAAFDCGPVYHPRNLRAQVEGGIVMGLGGALSEAIAFENGRITNARFEDYLVPRFEDVPELEVVIVERNDVSAVGAGETPIIAVAPAIANAVYQATGEVVTGLPVA